jgi:hypothetical protein
MRGTLVLGAGPGGTGPMVWAAQNGRWADWLARGVALLDRSDEIGGSIGRYVINSDSMGTAYLECLDAPLARELLAPLRAHPVTAELETMRYGFPPLELVGRYLHQLGRILQRSIADSPHSEFLPRTEVRALHLRQQGSVIAEAATSSGDTFFVEARTAIMALGGRQNMSAYLSASLLPGVRLAEVELNKIVPSDAILTANGLKRAAQLLANARRPRIVVLGGSHSGYSVLWTLTHKLPDVQFGPGDITLLSRRQPPVMYSSREDAAKDNYSITDRDICPRTLRVHRLGGLRGDGRETWRRLNGRPGTEPEERVVQIALSPAHLSAAALRQMLDEAAVIVPAFGYRGITIPVFDAEGKRVRLAADHGGVGVDREARMVLADGGSLPNIFGIGLGVDYRPWGHMGGEPSFDGQANGLWLYQNDIGAVVYQSVQKHLEEAERPRVSRRYGRLTAALSPSKIEEVLTEDASLLAASLAPAQVPAAR